ncbi:MAG TPA: hypothetical protein VGX48_08885 [Pyrinomonadaceae bacterium]|jgi:hypothetical protein|nr:hypothetical protein [Pyrinomonadaceae bacterium]
MGDKFKVPPGSTLDVTLGRKRRKARPQAPPARDERGIIPVESNPTRYVFRGKPSIIFLDLGTRLRSVAAASWTGGRYRPASETTAPARDDTKFDEYVELEYERAAPAQLATPTLAEFQALDARLIGSRAPGSSDTLDPLSTTAANVTARALYNCMPLPHDGRWLYATVGVGGELFKLSADEGERPDEWKAREAAAADADERWNELNLAAGVAHGSGVLKAKGPVGRLRVVAGDYSEHGLARAVGAYEEFDTADEANFKVTSESSFSADAVPLSLAGSADVRVYLKPRMLRYELSTGAGGVFRWDGRVPVYPDLYIFRNASSQEDLNRRAMCAMRRSPLASAHYDANPPPSGQTAFLRWPSFTAADVPPVLTVAGALCCVIAQGVKVFFVWRKTARALDFGEDKNPYSGGVLLDTPC